MENQKIATIKPLNTHLKGERRFFSSHSHPKGERLALSPHTVSNVAGFPATRNKTRKEVKKNEEEILLHVQRGLP